MKPTKGSSASTSKSGTYRNLRPMEGRPGLFEFEVKDKSGKWHKMTNLGAESEEDRKAFAQNTADSWVKR